MTHSAECEGIVCWDTECDCITTCPVCGPTIPPKGQNYLKRVGRWAVP